MTSGRRAALGVAALAAAVMATWCAPWFPVVEQPQAPSPGSDSAAPEECRFQPPRARALAKAAPVARPKIVGGKPVPWVELQFLVALANRAGVHYCTGTLLADGWVLTAAHCQPDLSDIVLVWPGVEPSSLTNARALAVVDVRVHPDWYEPTLAGDMALVRLSHDPGLQHVEFAGAPDVGIARAAGWGRTCETCEASQYLLAVDVPIRPPADCEIYSSFGPNHVCAGDVGADACFGDSGGPLLVREKQVALTSFGRGCARYPGAYHRVDVPWVRACASVGVP